MLIKTAVELMRSRYRAYVNKDEEYILSAQDIVIEDEGKGIDSDSIHYIFDRFFQGDNKTDIQGSGIGLTLVKSLVDIHKMNLSVYSKEGIGTKFIIAIPNIDYREVFDIAENQTSVKLSKTALSPLIPNENMEIDSKVELFEKIQLVSHQIDEIDTYKLSI